MLKPRYKVFLEELPKNKNKIKPAAIKAGYSEMYADKQGKILLNNAVKASARDIVEQMENKVVSTGEAKVLMNELLGISREEVFLQLNKIAKQDKDYSSALKVLKPLSKELGVDLSEEQSGNVTVPVLNVVVSKPQIDTSAVDNLSSNESKDVV